MTSTSATTRWAAPGALLVGAATLAAAMALLDAPSAIIPALVGAAALVAGIAGRRASAAVAGATLLGFGLAVLAVRLGPLPSGREAPAVVVGLAAGVGVGALIARWLARPADVAVASLAMLALGGAFWFAFDAAWILDWPLWSAVLVVWAISTAVQDRSSGSR